MYRWLYNTLNRWTRRVKVHKTSILTTIAVIMIPTAFLLLTTSVSRYWSWGLAIIGFASLIWALFRANKEDKESKVSRDGLTKAINDLVNEINIDRIERNKETKK